MVGGEMKYLRDITINVPAGSVDSLATKGNYIRLKTAPAGVTLRVQNQNGNDDVSLVEGDAVNLGEFESLQLSHTEATAQSFTVTIGNGTRADSAKVGGSVAVSGLPDEQGAYTQAAATVTNASGVLVAANAARRALLISNQSSTGNIYINLAGAAATVAGGVKIAAGGVLLLDRYPPTGAIYAIGDIASNADVIVAEG